MTYDPQPLAASSGPPTVLTPRPGASGSLARRNHPERASDLRAGGHRAEIETANLAEIVGTSRATSIRSP